MAFGLRGLILQQPAKHDYLAVFHAGHRLQ